MKITELNKGDKFIRKQDRYDQCYIKINIGMYNAIRIKDGEAYYLKEDTEVRPIVL